MTPANPHAHTHAHSSLRASSASHLPSMGKMRSRSQLLQLCDDVRVSLRDASTLGPRGKNLVKLLKDLLAAERAGEPGIDILTIRYAHLDKLIAELHGPAEVAQPAHQEHVAIAEALETLWQKRFRAAWFELDDTRLKALSTGRLKDIDYCEPHKDALERWRASNGGGDPASDIDFDTGDWWLNLACAHRDGIVGSAYERPTKGLYGIAALPLITGQEEVLGDGVCKYVRLGRNADMHYSLMSQVGAKTRILRGHRLQSTLAPLAGVRYDGLYKIKNYSHVFDIVERKHRLEVTLERLAGQEPVDPEVPRPSQMDDWHLFEKHEVEVVKQRKGDHGYNEFKLLKEEERHTRERWRQSTDFRASLNLAPRSNRESKELKEQKKHASGSADLKTPDAMGKDKNAGGKSAGKKGKGGGDDSKDSKESGATKVKGAQSINVRHILCEKHSKKEEALAKIRDGVKFDEVAREFSEDKARQGGSLGWKSRGSLDPKFEEIAFGLEASSTGSPSIGEAKTGFGYHIIMVEGRK
ncbi:hypothetical protein F5X68DRAFT_231812 [Plectosphaerella plurivora]|uniref:peptidylprolyl isomerase n=1 Tax=Plectosphaerella plurivora TaxID=936078 RepID=A0A9P9AAG5_9PEZI|nr:hypothetical protein F5X68DRAFT_231812 [Plectosphaerella plurivora]